VHATGTSFVLLTLNGGYSPQPQPTTLPGTQDQSLQSHQDGNLSPQVALPSSVLLPAVSSTLIKLIDLDQESIPSSLKKEGSDWFALFNTEVPRQLDVDLVHTLDHHSVVCCVNFSHDGKYLATGCNRSAQIFDTQTGHKVSVLQNDSVDWDGDLYIRDICFSPDGKYLITGAEDKLIRVRMCSLLFLVVTLIEVAINRFGISQIILSDKYSMAMSRLFTLWTSLVTVDILCLVVVIILCECGTWIPVRIATPGALKMVS
jgi:WD40 repeat protein